MSFYKKTPFLEIIETPDGQGSNCDRCQPLLGLLWLHGVIIQPTASTRGRSRPRMESWSSTARWAFSASLTISWYVNVILTSFIARALLSTNAERDGHFWKASLRGIIEGHLWEASLRGFFEEYLWGASLKGIFEGHLWGASLRGNLEGQPWGASLRSSFEGHLRGVSLRGILEGHHWRASLRGIIEGHLRKYMYRVVF